MGDASVKTTKIVRTATPMMTISPSGTTERYIIYRCDECRALLLGAEDGDAHLTWHNTLLKAPSS